MKKHLFAQVLIPRDCCVSHGSGWGRRQTPPLRLLHFREDSRLRPAEPQTLGSSGLSVAVALAD